MSKKRSLLLVFVLAVGLATAGGASRAQTRPEVTEEFHQSYPLAAGGRVALSNINGKVRVAAWDRHEVKVDAVKRASKAERLREAEIRVRASGAGVEIETEYPDNYWSDRDWDRDDQPAAVDYTLTVPRGARLDEINLINGSLDIEGVGGAVRAASVNGGVTARNLVGAVKLSVINGRLEASFDRLGETVSLSSVNGAVDVTIPSDANAHLRASTVHGRISNDFNLPVREGEYVGRDLEGRLGAGGARLSLSNVNGAISIRRAGDGRPLSPATNLLSETPSRDFGDADDDADDDREIAREAAREAREAAREIARAAREARLEAARERREGQQETEQGRREALREAEQERQETLREALREAERERREAERERKRELDEVTREAAQIAREVSREVGRSVAVHEHAPRQIARESNAFAVSGAPRVRVETFDGAINVHAWDKPEVMYTAVKRAFSDREMKGIKLLAQPGPEITIRAEFDKSFAHEVTKSQGQVVMFSSGASVELDLYVPRNATLVLSSGDGRLSVDGVSGELDLHTGDGPVDVVGGGGKLRVNTGDGRIRIENFDGEADARTGDGRITLEGRFRQLTARTGDGTISLALAEGSSADIETNAETVVNDGVAVAADPSNEGRVRRWRVGSGGQLFTLRTGDGQIILRRR